MNHTTRSPRSQPARRARVVLVTCAAALTLTAAACGGDDDAEPAATAPTMTEPTGTEPMGTEPMGTDPMTTEMGDDMGTEPMSTEPMGTEPMGTEPMGTEPMGTDPMTTEMGDDMMGPAMEPSGPGCAAVPADGEGSFGGMADDPAATAAANNPVLSTLVAAVGQAGLVDTLNGDGPFTIFAPTNDAFAAVPTADLDAVLADTELLTSVLTYHVVAGEQLSSADLIAAGRVTTVQGDMLTIAAAGDTFTVNGAEAICIDVPTANATVHIIDRVLLPAG